MTSAPRLVRLRPFFLAAALSANALSAATIAHWTDFSGTVVQDTVGDFDLSRADLSTDWFATPDNAVFTSKTLTLEVIVSPTTISSSGSTFLAGQFRSDQTNQRAYALIINKDTKRLQLAICADGTNATVLDSGFTVSTGKTYYFAASFDLSSANAAERTATIYLKETSNPNATLQQTVFSSIGITSIFNSTSPFALGAMGSGASEQYFGGTFSEARLSNSVLGLNQLLVAAPIPEPASAASLFGGLALGFASLRRRRR